MKHILFIISLFISLAVIASDYEEREVFKKVYKASQGIELNINNKHGNIEFQTWDKDSVSLSVEVIARSSNDELVYALMDDVEINFSRTPSTIYASTNFGSSFSKIRTSMIKLVNDQYVAVNYIVKLPKSMNITIENKFGNVIVENHEGRINLDLQHGNLFANELAGELKVISRYAELSIHKLNEAEIDARFSTIIIQNAKELELKIVSTKTSIDNVHTLDVNSSLSEIEIEELTGELKADIKYGELDIDRVDAKFKEIDVEGSNTNIKLDFAEEAAYAYNVLLEKGKAFRIPSEGNVTKSQNLMEDMNIYEGEFSAKKGLKTNSKVKIEAKRTYITLGLD